MDYNERLDQLSPFVRSYIETALWSSTDEFGIPLDNEKYADAELSEETIGVFIKDCERFEAEYVKAINALDYVSGDFAWHPIAHDFWLTRNGHGAGFWDGDYPKEVGIALTRLAKSFGECELYVGDDGKVFTIHC